MRVALVEDEVPALEHLERVLLAVHPAAEVIARLRTVRALAAWLAADAAGCDLILADIQLGDGLSLDAFASAPTDIPIVFTTAYDHHLAPALAGNGIAYLLKPLDPDALAAALRKRDRLQRHFVGGIADLARRLTAPPQAQRLVGRRGVDWVGLPITDVRWLRVAHGITRAMAATGAEIMMDDPLNQLQARLSPFGFFRANRWYLVSLAAVVRVHPAGRGPPDADPRSGLRGARGGAAGERGGVSGLVRHDLIFSGKAPNYRSSPHDRSPIVPARPHPCAKARARSIPPPTSRSRTTIFAASAAWKPTTHGRCRRGRCRRTK